MQVFGLRHIPLHKPLLIGDTLKPERRLWSLPIPLPKLRRLWQRPLRPQTPKDLLLRYPPLLNQKPGSLKLLLPLPPLPFIQQRLHIGIRPMHESLKSDKPVLVLCVAELVVGAPLVEMVVFEDEFLAFGLLPLGMGYVLNEIDDFFAVVLARDCFEF